MATTLTLPTITFDIRNGSMANDDVLAPNNVPLGLAVALALANGTGAGKANQPIIKQYTIAALGTQNVDLAGILTNPLNQVVTLTKVKVIVVYLHSSPAAVSILIGGHATAGFANWIASAGTFGTDKPQVRCGNGPNGGLFVDTRQDATGFAVTATTGDILLLTNEDAALAALVDVYIIGEGTAV